MHLGCSPSRGSSRQWRIGWTSPRCICVARSHTSQVSRGACLKLRMPILQTMADPVIASDGHVYERSAILRCINGPDSLRCAAQAAMHASKVARRGWGEAPTHWASFNECCEWRR